MFIWEISDLLAPTVEVKCQMLFPQTGYGDKSEEFAEIEYVPYKQTQQKIVLINMCKYVSTCS